VEDTVDVDVEGIVDVQGIVESVTKPCGSILDPCYVRAR